MQVPMQWHNTVTLLCRQLCGHTCGGVCSCCGFGGGRSGVHAQHFLAALALHVVLNVLCSTFGLVPVMHDC